MVHRRGSKFGVVTSRTLRKTEYFSKPRVFYNGQFVVTKYVEQGHGQHLTISKEFQEILQDGLEVCGHTPFSTTDTPEYSLNKRKRWLLPHLLKEAITDGELEELPFRVSLVERAPQVRSDPKEFMGDFYCSNQPDCLQVTRSKCLKHEFKPKAKYSFEAYLLGDRKRRWGGINHSVKEDDDDPSDNRLPELTYEVCYPRRKSDYPTFTPLCTTRVHMHEKFAKVERAKQKKKMHRLEKLYWEDDERNMMGQACNVILDETGWGIIDDAELEDVVEPPQDVKTKYSCFGDFVTCDSKPKTSRRRKKRRTTKRVSSKAGQHLFSSSSKKNCTILDPTIKLEEESTDLTDSSSRSSSDSGFSDTSETMFTFDPVDYTTVWQEVTLEKSSLEELSIARTFGDSLLDYTESDPYCAAINLCRIDENVSETGRYDEVILMIQRIAGNSSTTHCRFRVCDLRGDRRDFVDTSMVSIDEQLVHSVLEFVEIVKQSLGSHLRPSEDHKVKCRKPKDLIRLDTVSSLLGWQYKSKAEDEVLEEMMHQEAISSARSFSSYQPCIQSPPETCAICFDDIIKTEGSLPSATALRRCSHWFCGSCWQQHVTSRTQQGDVNIKCPAFECNTPVDRTTQLALLPDPFLPLYSRLRRSRLLTRQKAWEWCQNPMCSRMVQVEGSKPPHNGDDQKNVIHCECGYSWCHGCKESVHWPATCQQAAEYKDYVENKGVDIGEDRITAVEVKRCPECSYPIEKHGGCMHMVCCFCDYEFCWECLSSWMSHLDDWKDCLQIPTVSVSLSGKKRSSAEMYLLAATAKRKERQSAGEVTTSAERIGVRVYYQYLKRTNNHLCRSNPCVVSAFQKSYSATWISSEEKLRQFEDILRLCESASNLFNEISFILEYLNVLIATGKTKQLRLRSSGWKDTMDKLGFISLRLCDILTGQRTLRYPEFSANLQRLVQTGKQRLKEVIGALPGVYKLLTTLDNNRHMPVAVS